MTYETKFAVGDTVYYCYIYDGEVKTFKHTIARVVITNEGVFYACDFVRKEYEERLFSEDSLCFEEEISDYELKSIERQIKDLREQLKEQERKKEELICQQDALSEDK